MSTGHLVDPEELEPGNIQRTTASTSWFRQDDADFSAVTVGYGLNGTEHGDRQAVFAEGTRRTGRNSLFGRVEVLQVETNTLLNDEDAGDHDSAAREHARGVYGRRRARPPAVAWRGSGSRREYDALCRAAHTRADTWRPPGVVSDILARAAARLEYGAHVEHADVAAHAGFAALTGPRD